MAFQEEKIDPKVGLAHTLPAKLYVNPEALEEEKEKIFRKTWQYVGHVSKVRNPGDYFTCEVADEPLIIVRGNDGEIRAFYNVCLHRAAKVVEGEGCKKILQCPYHAWTFNLDGSLNKAPNFKGVECFEKENYGLSEVKVEVAADAFIFVNLDQHALPMSTTFGKLFEEFKQYNFGELKQTTVFKGQVKANWKLVIDNYLECDHCPVAHPALIKTLDMKNYFYKLFENYSYQYSPMKDNKGKIEESTQLNFEDGILREGKYYWLWPNLMISFNPGPKNFSTYQVIPIDVETTESVYTTYFLDDIMTEEHEKTLKLIEITRNEDFALIENVQKGLRSRAYTQGRFSLTEKAVHHFHLLMQKALDTHQ